MDVTALKRLSNAFKASSVETISFAPFLKKPSSVDFALDALEIGENDDKDETCVEFFPVDNEMRALLLYTSSVLSLLSNGVELLFAAYSFRRCRINNLILNFASAPQLFIFYFI